MRQTGAGVGRGKQFKGTCRDPGGSLNIPGPLSAPDNPATLLRMMQDGVKILPSKDSGPTPTEGGS